jgi:Fic family protein
MSNTKKIHSQIMGLRERYYKSATHKQALVQLMAEAEIAEHVYNSNAIENSTLNLEETEKILLQMDLERFISERELFEAKNLARVTEYIAQIAPARPLNMHMILLLHKMLILNIRDDIAGRFRQGNEFVKVANHIAPAPREIEPNLNEMLGEFNASPHLPIAQRIAKLHVKFEVTHPFIDGNGRIGRALNNYLLIREGYVPINIKYINRAQYYDAFAQFERKGELSLMEDIVGAALCNSYHKRLAYLEEKKIISLNDYAKQNGLSHSNLINKATRQTIEAFLERGVWKIGT